MQAKRSKIRIHHKDELPNIMKLDINKLGRPYHKIPKIFTDCFDLLDAKISIYFLKKYRVNVALKDMEFQMDYAQKYTQIFSTQIGSTGFTIDRMLLLNILNDYYGLSKEQTQIQPNENSPITKTEERLRNKLGSELTRLILCHELFHENLEVKQDHSSVISHWSYRIKFSLEGYNEGYFYIFLDNAHIDKLLTILRAPVSDGLKNSSIISPQRLDAMISTLPIRLTGKLASVRMTIDQLMQLKPGDVVPISMPDRSPLYIGQQQLFSAVVAEERGKLFFSEFNDKANEMKND